MGVLIERTPDRGPDPHSATLKRHAEALFASTLQASDHPSGEQVRRAVTTTLDRLGTAGCAARLAVEFGEHPELAAPRMTWALATIRGNHLTAESVLDSAPPLAGLGRLKATRPSHRTDATDDGPQASAEQGWSLLCNGVVVFDDTDQLIPNGDAVAPVGPTHDRLPVPA